MQRIELPTSVARYFAAANHPITESFTPDAVVLDEGGEHRGHAAIAAWNAAAVAKYAMTTEVLRAESTGSRVDVRAKVSGTFPGSPIELGFRFTLRDDLIARLEIG